MNLFQCAFLADENIHPDVITYLRELGLDVLSVSELGLNGQSDATILSTAHDLERVVLTHDSDFGTLAIVEQVPVVGIVYLRPAHIRSTFIIQMIAALKEQAVEVTPPFIVTTVRQAQVVRIRVRHL